MLFRAILLFSAAILPAAADWVQFKSGPFEVLSAAGERPGRDTLNFLEQLRFSLGTQLGAPDVQPVWPVRVYVLKKGAAVKPLPKLGADAYLLSITEIDPATTAAMVKLLIDGWPGILPPNLERGLLQVYSTIDIEGTRIRVGAVPAQKDRDWSRAHMFVVHPDYSGKLRVLLGNLSRGVESEVAYRNAFGQTAEQIEQALNRYIEAGEFSTIAGASRPMNPRRELLGKEVPDPGMEQAFAQPSAVETLARMKTREELLKATELNKRWAAPWKRLAAVETHPAQKTAALRKAAELDPRDAAVWMELAELQENAKQFPEAAKSWAAAERTTDDPTERTRIRERRIAGEKRRVDAQIAAREEARRKTEEELQALRNKALLEIRAAEARANAGKPVIDPKTLGEYKEGAGTQKLSGTLTRVDCMGGRQARLHVASGKQTTRLLVADPGQVELAGGGVLSFTCGLQRPGRAVTIDYVPKSDAANGTAGEPVKIEFRR